MVFSQRTRDGWIMVEEAVLPGMDEPRTAFDVVKA
jgi:hypothetical protein